MKKLMLFAVGCALLLMATVVRDNSYRKELVAVRNGISATQTAEHVLPEVTPTPTEKPILMSDLESLSDCGLVLAKVHVGTVKADLLNPPSWEMTNLHEVWKIYVFGGPEKIALMRSDMNLNDRWGNPIEARQFNATIADIPLTAENATFYNEYGVLAGWNEGYNHYFKKSGFCHKVEGEVSWTKDEDLHKFAEFTFEYPTGSIGASEGDNFVAEFYVGKELGWKDFDILWFKAIGLNSDEVNWNGSHNFGPVSVDTSFFGIDFNNTVQWCFVQDNPNLITTVNTNVFFPTEREIVIKTTYASGKTGYQRLVIHRWLPDNAPIVITIKP